MAVFVKPPEHIEKLYPGVNENGAVQKKIADAPATSGRVGPELQGDDEALKTSLKPTAARDNIESERKIADAARQGIEERAGHAIQEEGRAGERASMARLQNGGEIVDDLNRYQESFPLVDVSSDQRMQSIKVKSVDSPADSKVYDRYRYDFEKLQDLDKSGKAADALQKYGAQLPSELGANPSHDRLSAYIREKCELGVPDDHVDGVRQNIADMARRVPGRYALDASSPTLEQDIQKLIERVQPIGIKSSEISRMRHLS